MANQNRIVAQQRIVNLQNTRTSAHHDHHYPEQRMKCCHKGLWFYMEC